MKIRAAAFIDGFNLYHAVDDSRQSQFKWLDLCALIEVFIPASQFDLVAVYYFSAYATWRANAYKRHREEAIGPETSAERKEYLRQRLLEYCKIDTLAMVRLVEFLGSDPD